VTDQHPTVPSWSPAPPPARRRLGPGLVAGLIAALLLFGGVGLFAARQVAGSADGASSPEAAATGLLTALGRQDYDRAAGYLDEEERLLVATYRDRLTDLLAAGVAGQPGRSPAGLELTARDVRFRRLADLGGADVAVVELAGGVVGGRDARGAKLEAPVAELNRRLAAQTRGAVGSLQAVAVRDGDRWRVSLLASAAEFGRLASGAAEPDWDRLAGSGQPPSGGAASPEAAVRGLGAAVVDSGGTVGPVGAAGTDAAIQALSPTERRVLAAYHPVLGSRGKASPAVSRMRVEGLQTRTEQVAEGVARVHATGGRLVFGDMLDKSVPLGFGGADPAPYVVAIQQDGTWYPSLRFTAIDWMLTRAERERP
jgi:hypothetical protein